MRDYNFICIKIYTRNGCHVHQATFPEVYKFEAAMNKMPLVQVRANINISAETRLLQFCSLLGVAVRYAGLSIAVSCVFVFCRRLRACFGCCLPCTSPPVASPACRSPCVRPLQRLVKIRKLYLMPTVIFCVD